MAIIIPPQYQPRLLTQGEREGYLDWSLNFFTDPSLFQIPYLDLTLQLDVTHAYQTYQGEKTAGSSFFSFLIWHWLQCLQSNWGFRLRYVDQKWYILDNPPVMVSVAIGGKERFAEMLLENTSQLAYADFIPLYRQTLDNIRSGNPQRADYQTFCLATIFGNLPNLQFSGLTIHYRRETIQGQPWFYFGKRYWVNDQLLIPLCVKMHHANSDPFVLDQLVAQFQSRFMTENKS
jgi:chloramphenicol O-acetyltransferase